MRAFFFKIKKYGDILCLRYSYFEGIDTIKNFVGEIKWVWIDTYKDFELTNEIADILKTLTLFGLTLDGSKEKVSIILAPKDLIYL